MFSRRPKGATMHNQGKSGIASLLWMLFGAIVTLGVGVFMYKSGVFDLGAQNQPQDNQKQIQTKVDLNKSNDAQKYDFYEVLPDQDSKTIPDTLVPDQPTNKDIKKQAANFKPDVVVISTKEELGITSSSKDTMAKQFKPAVSVNESNEMIVEYEKSTYGDDELTHSHNDKSAHNLDLAKKTKAEELFKPDISNSIKPLTTKDPETKPTGNDEKSNHLSTSTKTIIKTNTDTANSEPVAIVQPASDNDKASKPTKVNKSYILQINSFDSADEADHRRAQVLMAGIDDAYVVKKTINDQTVYQVVSNSMSSKESVIQNQQRLKNSGIDSLVIEQRVK